MWLMTDTGFYSATFKDGQIQVRARDAADLDRLRDRYAPELGPNIETFLADYPYRALLAADQWGTVCSRIGSNIRYDNFKSEVGRVMGHERASIYSRIWGILWDVETPETTAARKTTKSPWVSSLGGQTTSFEHDPLTIDAQQLLIGDVTDEGTVIDIDIIGRKKNRRVFVQYSTGVISEYRPAERITIL